jgi:hypothetical protein
LAMCERRTLYTEIRDIEIVKEQRKLEKLRQQIVIEQTRRRL